MGQREKGSPANPLVRPLANQSRHRHRPSERHRRHRLQTKGVALLAAPRLLRLPVGRRRVMSKGSIGRTFQPKTNMRFLRGLTSFSPVTWTGLRLL
jgi:hypothetical protein